jgi:hypothetical protein
MVILSVISPTVRVGAITTILDQQCSTVGGFYLNGIGASEPAGQTFTPTQTSVVAFSINIYSTSPFPTPMTAKILAGGIGGAVQGSVNFNVPAVFGLPSGDWFKVQFTSGVPVIPGSIYALDLTDNLASSGIKWNGCKDSYPGGKAYSSGSYNTYNTVGASYSFKEYAFGLTVTPVATPDFSISSSLAAIPVTQGGSNTATITVTSINGLNSAVDLSASWVGSAPTGVTFTLPTPITPPSGSTATSPLIIVATGSASTGSFTLRVTGTSGLLSHDVIPDITIQVAAVTTSTTTPPTPATDWAVLSVSLSPSAPHVGDPVTFSMVVTALSSPGPFPQSFAAVCQIDGVSCGGGSHTYPGPLDTPFTVSAQTPWIATVGTHTLTWGVATIPVGLDPDKSNNMKSTTFTVAQASSQQTTTASSTASQAPDFQVNVSPPSQTVLQGETTSYAVDVAGLNGFNSQVSLSVSGLPPGANGVFSNPSGTPNFASTLTVILSGDVATGSYTLVVTGSGGGLSHVANLVLTVNAAVVTQTSASSTETVASSTQTSSDLTSMIQQNQLLILAAVVLLAAVIIAVALRGRRKPTSTTN